MPQARLKSPPESAGLPPHGRVGGPCGGRTRIPPDRPTTPTLRRLQTIADIGELDGASCAIELWSKLGRLALPRARGRDSNLRRMEKAPRHGTDEQKHRGKFALAAPRVEVVLVPEEQPTSADQVALAAGTLFDAYLVLHLPDGEPPKTIRLDGGPFDKEGAINIILATYSTLTEKYAEAHLKRSETPSAVYDAKIEKN